MKSILSFFFVFTLPLSTSAQHAELLAESTENDSRFGSAVVFWFSDDVSLTGASFFAKNQSDRHDFSLAVFRPDPNPFLVNLRNQRQMRSLSYYQQFTMQSFAQDLLLNDLTHINAGISVADQFQHGVNISGSNRRTMQYMLPPSEQLRREMDSPPTTIDLMLRGTMGIFEAFRGN